MTDWVGFRRSVCLFYRSPGQENNMENFMRMKHAGNDRHVLQQEICSTEQIKLIRGQCATRESFRTHPATHQQF